MFGALNEAQASCGHWVVWDTKAPNTEHLTTKKVSRAPCWDCRIAALAVEIRRLEKQVDEYYRKVFA